MEIRTSYVAVLFFVMLVAEEVTLDSVNRRRTGTNMKQIKICIYGSCVSREIFNCDESKIFTIGKYFNFCSIFSQMDLSELRKIKEDELGHESQWYSQIIAADINKDALEQIKSDSPDWIILDLMSERLLLTKIKDREGHETLITAHDNIKKCNFYRGNEEFYVSNENIDPVTFTIDYVDSVVKKFCEALISICPVERIIFCESFFVREYVTKKGSVELFDNILQRRGVKINSWLEKLEKMLLQYLDGCNIIYFPRNTFADELHHLHLAPTHYLKNYYRYAFETVKSITCCRAKLKAEDMQKIDNEEMYQLLQRS